MLIIRRELHSTYMMQVCLSPLKRKKKFQAQFYRFLWAPGKKKGNDKWAATLILGVLFASDHPCGLYSFRTWVIRLRFVDTSRSLCAEWHLYHAFKGSEDHSFAIPGCFCCCHTPPAPSSYSRLIVSLL